VGTVIEESNALPLSVLQQAATAAEHLSNEAPSSVEQDADALSKDLAAMAKAPNSASAATAAGNLISDEATWRPMVENSVAPATPGTPASKKEFPLS
jgi:hypothetical protein